MSDRYFGKICVDKTFLWVGPMTKGEMKEDFDIFRHNSSAGKPKGRIIGREEALKIMRDQ